MTLESTDSLISVHQLTGFATFRAVELIEEEILAEAGLERVDPPSAGRRSPTTFHVACDAVGRPLGVAASTIGPLAQLPIGLALAQAGVDLSVEQRISDPACELVSISVDLEAVAADRVGGVSEALYRSFYRRARASEARSAVVGVDPWLYDVLTEEYGIPFEVLGPPIELLGRELLAVGGDLDVLEAGLATASPEFARFLNEPYRPAAEAEAAAAIAVERA